MKLLLFLNFSLAPMKVGMPYNTTLNSAHQYRAKQINVTKSIEDFSRRLAPSVVIIYHTLSTFINSARHGLSEQYTPLITASLDKSESSKNI